MININEMIHTNILSFVGSKLPAFIFIFFASFLYALPCTSQDSQDSTVRDSVKPVIIKKVFTTNITPRQAQASVTNGIIENGLDSLALDSLNRASALLNDSTALSIDSLQQRSNTLARKPEKVLTQEEKFVNKCNALGNKSTEAQILGFLKAYTSSFYFENGQLQNEDCFIQMAKSVNKGTLLIAVNENHKLTKVFKRLKIRHLLDEIGLDRQQFKVKKFERFKSGITWLGSSKDLKIAWEREDKRNLKKEKRQAKKKKRKEDRLLKKNEKKAGKKDKKKLKEDSKSQDLQEDGLEKKDLESIEETKENEENLEGDPERDDDDQKRKD